MLKRLLFTALFAFSSYFLFAQETTSQILGTVTEGNSGLPGATVTALHTPTGTKYSTTTRKDGRYNLPNLRVGGPYTISVTYVGYKTEVQDSITLAVGQDYTGDFSLKPASTQLSEVVVTGTAQSKIFNNSRTGSQEIITRTQIQQLPSINRSISDFTKLEPTSNGLSFSGASSSFNNITVDGSDFNNSFGLSGTLGGQANAQPIALDAIDQIQVNVSPYDVRQGGFTGAGVNTVTRSGTNKFRGTIYDYTKGPGLQGYRVENNTIAKTPFSFNTLGGSLGGASLKINYSFSSMLKKICKARRQQV